MSKSLGNFFTLRDLLDQGFTGREVRFVLISAHYRETFNFTMDGLRGGRTALRRIDDCVAKLQDLAKGGDVQPAQDLLSKFTVALDDDLNVSSAWAVVFDWVRDMNRLMAEKTLNPITAAENLTAWSQIESALGIGAVEEGETPQEILDLMAERLEARKQKNFGRADEIRDELTAAGWTIEDTPEGPRAKRA